MMPGKTYSEIAKEIGVSRQAIYQKIKRSPELSTRLQPFTVRVDNVVYISEEGESILKTAFSDNVVNSGLQSFTVNSLQETVNSLQVCLQEKQAQIEDKDKQIELLTKQLELKDKQISDTTTALLQAQQLHAADRQKLLSIEEQQKQAQQEEQTIQEPEPDHKPRFWERLFTKRKKQ